MNSRHAIPAPPSSSISVAARLSLLVRAHTLYQAALSPLLHSLGLVPGGCRFQPTCSQYATLAIAEHGWLRGLALSVSRLLRCHPLARGGWDPVAPLRAAELAAAHPASSATGAPAAGTIDMPDSTHDPA